LGRREKSAACERQCRQPGIPLISLGENLTQRSAKGKRKSSPWAVRRAKGRAMNEGKALVLFSGGQDSTTCLAWALDRFAQVETVGFNYGQRHLAEMGARPVVRAA